MAIAERQLSDELSGLDNLELGGRVRRSRLARLWGGLWPKLAATALFFFIWQVVVWSGWKPTYVLPGPGAVLSRLWEEITEGGMLEAMGNTLRRGATGYALAVVLGTIIGALVSRVRLLRVAVGSMITGLQTMPSIAWFPLAILLFKLSDAAIIFVVVIGATPAIANGLISGADQVPPVLIRAGRVLGARGLTLYRHVILPAALPGFVGGLKQGWAFAWRSLLAGELLVIIAEKPSLGFQLETARQLSDADWVMANMMMIFFIGVVIDALFFGTIEKSIRRRRGLIDAADL
jgi:NitT/TauT family transport system permease protein